MKKHGTRITVSELRNNLPMILSKVKLLKETYVITNHGRPMAVLEPYKEEPRTDIKSPKQ